MVPTVLHLLALISEVRLDDFYHSLLTCEQDVSFPAGWDMSVQLY